MRHLGAITVALGLAMGTAHLARPAKAQSAEASSCERLVSLQLPGTAITLAQVVGAGAFAPPGASGGSIRGFQELPAFCRVAATLTPSGDSDIKVEVWMPVANWNGKLQGVGNGAFTGSIRYSAMAPALQGGYATASTDTGHVGGRASFALGHPEKVIDFGWRAVHEMTVVAKAIIAAHYGSDPRFSYWNGCSAGGRQGIKEAQRFPSDYDGIVAGAPGGDWTGRAARAVLAAQALEPNEAPRLLEAERQLVHQAALDACDLDDGVKDGIISDPERCTFDPGVLQCRGGSDESCLTPAQVATARMLYSTEVNPKTRREIGGLLPGSELGWTDMGWSASARATGLDQFRFLVFKDPGWEVDRFDFAADLVRAEEVDGDTVNALDPDLGAFIRGGGKLLQYHGWSDPQISPANSTQYYRRVMEAVQADRADDSYRLFMAPGMAHCRGGEGPDTFDAIAALDAWVDRGVAPDRLIASHLTRGRVDRTRPLCPYPQVARYAGSGSTDDAASFVCRMP